MFSGKVANNDLNRTHKRALRFLFNDFTSSFDELLLRRKECAFHQNEPAKVNARGLLQLNKTKSFIFVGYAPPKGH